jgi:DNA-binding XRE family transcriptional regulator
MTLGDYISRKKMTDERFAELVSCNGEITVDRSTITKLRGGSRRPSWKLAMRIAEVTNGAVSLEEWARDL